MRLLQLSGAVCAPLLVLCSACATLGETIEVTLTQGTNMAVAVSPSSSQVVLDVQGTLWALDAEGRGTALTDGLGDDRQPVFSPDGGRIAFQSYRDGTWHIWSMAADGSDLTQHTTGPFDHREPHYSPDGRRIAMSSARSGNYDVYELDLGSGDVIQRTTDRANDYSPAYAPDGARIRLSCERR